MALFGPKLLAARLLCPVLPNDNPRSLALRALDSLCHSIKAWCSLHSRTIPKETQKIGTWLAGTGSSTFTVELPIMGLGGNVVRTIQLPKATEAPIEAIANALAALAAEAVNKLQFDGVFVALENLENLSDDELASMLISFRETLFAIPNVWWVLIGQSGLGSLIQSLDPRVADRTTGSGIEIGPIELEELEHAIALRVSRFRKSSKALSPLTSHTHRHLFEASDGEMRSLFKYSSSICARFVKEMRSNVLKNSTSKPSLPNSRINRNQFEQTLHNAVGEELVNSQIPHLIAENYLNAIVESELKGLFLKPMEETVLEGIGNKGNTYANDYDDFGLCSMQEFSSNYLSKLYEQKLLTCQHEGREVNYRLHGIAKLSHSFGLLRYQVPSSCIIFKFPKQDFETITHHD